MNPNKFAFLWASTASFTFLLIGYDIVVKLGANSIKGSLNITDSRLDLLVNIVVAYSAMSSLIGGIFCDFFGRRTTIIIAALMFFFGDLFMSLATHFAISMIGRFAMGLGVGFSLTATPVYIAEMAPTSKRGFLSSLPEVHFNAGLLLGHISHLQFSRVPIGLGWRCTLAIQAVLSLILLILAWFMPESPSWLVMRGRIAAASRILYRCTSTVEEANERLAQIRIAIQAPAHVTEDIVAIPEHIGRRRVVWWELINSSPVNFRILTLVLLLHIFQQFSGVDYIILYVFDTIDFFDGDTSTRIILIGVSFTISLKILAISVPIFLVDRVGRRKILLVATGTMVFLMGILGGLVMAINYDVSISMYGQLICIVSLIVFAATFSMGLGTIPWIYSSEVFDFRLRAQGVSFGVAFNRMTISIILFYILPFGKHVTIGGIYLFFTAIEVCGFFIFFKCIRETMGQILV